MTQYFRKVMCSERLPVSSGYYDTDMGKLHFTKYIKGWNPFHPDWWFEPVEEPLCTKKDMLSCWDAALSHALKLKGYYKTFSGFIKSLKK